MKEKILKKGFVKKIFSVILAAAVVVTLVPVSSLTANAENNQAPSETFTVNDVIDTGEKTGVNIRFHADYIWGNDAFQVYDEAGRSVKIYAMNNSKITRVECVKYNGPANGLPEDVISGKTATEEDGKYIIEGLDQGSVCLKCSSVSFFSSVIVYYTGGKQVLSSATVEVDQDSRSVTVKFGNDIVSTDEYDVKYGTAEETATEEFPTENGIYYAYITAKSGSTVCGGSVTSEPFEIHYHTYATTWTSDADNHWHAATCNHSTEKTDEATHTYGDFTSNNDATTAKDGTKSRTCKVCGYIETVADPGSKLPSNNDNDGTNTDNGKVAVSEDKQAGNFSAGGIKNSAEEVKSLVLTDTDKAAIATGKDVNVWVEMKENTNTVSSADKTAIVEKLPTDYTVGAYLDINLWKQLTGSDAEKITETANGNVKIGFTVPESLQKSGRIYKIIRIHDGEATILDTTVDSNYGLTFETDRFSTYALIYTDSSDVTNTGATTTSETAVTSTTSPKTGDFSNMALYILALVAAAGCVCVIVGRKRQNIR